MRRQGNIWTGTLPFILGLALLLGCFVCSAQVRAEGAETDVMQGAGAQSGATSLATGTGETGVTEPAPKKTAYPKTKAPSLSHHNPSTLVSLPKESARRAAARKQYTGKPVSLDLMDADLRNVLRLLSDLTGTNIVIEPDVTGKVTLKVEQVPWDQVLDMVLSMNDLGKEQVGNVIRIARQV